MFGESERDGEKERSIYINLQCVYVKIMDDYSFLFIDDSLSYL